MHSSSLLKCLKLKTQLTFVRTFSTHNPFIFKKDYYKTLQLNKNCSDKEVRDAYIRLSKEHHPDKNPEHKSAASEHRFIEINEAYSVLSKPATRRRYDTYREDCDSSNDQFASSYEELTHRYRQHHEFVRRRAGQRQRHDINGPIPISRVLVGVITVMFLVGIIEFNIVKKVVQGPDEIIDGIPIFHSNMVPPDLSLMTEEEQKEYRASKRRILEQTVRQMKAEKEANQREQDRLRIIIQSQRERESDSSKDLG